MESLENFINIFAAVFPNPRYLFLGLLLAGCSSHPDFPTHKTNFNNEWESSPNAIIHKEDRDKLQFEITKHMNIYNDWFGTYDFYEDTNNQTFRLFMQFLYDKNIKLNSRNFQQNLNSFKEQEKFLVPVEDCFQAKMEETLTAVKKANKDGLNFRVFVWRDEENKRNWLVFIDKNPTPEPKAIEFLTQTGAKEIEN